MADNAYFKRVNLPSLLTIPNGPRDFNAQDNIEFYFEGIDKFKSKSSRFFFKDLYRNSTYAIWIKLAWVYLETIPYTVKKKHSNQTSHYGLIGEHKKPTNW